MLLSGYGRVVSGSWMNEAYPAASHWQSITSPLFFPAFLAMEGACNGRKHKAGEGTSC